MLGVEADASVTHGTKGMSIGEGGGAADAALRANEDDGQYFAAEVTQD